MKLRDWIPYIIIAALLVYISFGKNEIEYVEVPAKENTRLITNPKPVVLQDTIRLINGGFQIVVKEREIDTTLLNKYKTLRDSIERLQVFKDAITLRNYVEQLTDTVQTITVESQVTGTLNSQRISYRTNPLKIPIKAVKNRASFFTGVYATLPQLPNEVPAVGLNLSLQNKTQIYTIGYDTQERIHVGVAFKLF